MQLVQFERRTTTRGRLRLGLALTALLAVGPAALGAQATSDPGQDAAPAPSWRDVSSIQLVSSVASIQPGTPFTLAVHITAAPGWHTYWINGGDAGDEVLVDWRLPEGFTVGEFRFPAPHLVPAPPLMSYGYDGQVFVLVDVTPPATLAPGTDVEIGGAADFQVCADTCLIALEDIALTLPVRAEPPTPDMSWGVSIDDAASHVPLPATGWSQRAWTNGLDGREDAYFILELKPNGEGSTPLPASLPAPHLFADEPMIIEHAAPQRVARLGDAIRIEVRRNYFADDFAPRLTGVVAVDVDAETPVAWGIDVEVMAEPPADVLAEAGNPFDDPATLETGGVPVGMAPLGRPDPLQVTEAPRGDAPPQVSLLLAFVFAFLGGAILNLMPCVFPVLSMKVLGFVEQGGDDPARARRHGLAFGAGVVLSFWILAGTLMALRAGGQSLGWGFQLQSPLIVGLLALLLFGLGLNLSGLFELGVGMTRLGAVGTGTSYRDSFLMGGLTVLVATPCTGPFMGAALGFALVQPVLIGLGVFTALAVGLAAPYVLLSSMPALLRRMPRPGAWMETFKQALAFPMYATVVWLVWVFGSQAGVDSTAMLLFGMTFLAFAGWLYGRFGGHAPSRRLRFSAVILAAVAAGFVVQGARTAQASEARDEVAMGWEAWSPERVAELRAEGRPIFIDFTADWCLQCKVNERVAIGLESVTAAFAEANVALLVADLTDPDPVITRELESFGRFGPPLYVMYPAKAEGETRVLPAILTSGILIEAIDWATQ